MNFLFYAAIFIFGVFVGSFLNSVIYRLETDQSFPFYRSFCPNCKHFLSAPDLIPILSFVLLGGRCRYCSEKISLQYLLVELTTGILFLLIYIMSENSFLTSAPFSLSYLFALFSILLVIFVYDLKHYLIPDAAIYSGVILVLIWRFFELLQPVFLGPEEFDWRIFATLLNPLLSATAPAILFWLIVFFSKEKWLGKGDIGLVFLVGLILGWPKILPALFISFVLGAIIGVWLIVLKKKTLKSEIPFGPFLVAGTFLAFFWGEKLISFYLGLIK